jgi:hypothetical protein
MLGWCLLATLLRDQAYLPSTARRPVQMAPTRPLTNVAHVISGMRSRARCFPVWAISAADPAGDHAAGQRYAFLVAGGVLYYWHSDLAGDQNFLTARRMLERWKAGAERRWQRSRSFCSAASATLVDSSAHRNPRRSFHFRIHLFGEVIPAQQSHATTF